VVLLISPRATLGQEKCLIQLHKLANHEFSGKATLPHYNGKQNQLDKEMALRPEWSGQWVSLWAPSPDVAAPTDVDAGRTDVSVDPA